MSSYDMQFLHTFLQEPVTYKAVPHILYFTIYGLYSNTNTYISIPTYTLSLATIQKTHIPVQLYGHIEQFTSPIVTIYGDVFRSVI